MDLVSAIGNAISLVQRLREISKKIAEAEFKSLLADLANKLADAKLEAASLKECLAELQEENRVLREVSPDPSEKPTGTKWGCYVFEGDDGLYCPACWDSKRQKSRTTRVTREFRHCPVCNAPIGTG
ncbi:MAG: hypothetical protein ACYS0K_14115 [Planctomycetota bacterium]|jgi:hypothetical protein